MKNIGLKIFCVFVAITLERYVHSRDNSSVISLLMPIEIKQLPENKIVIWPLNRQVQVTVQGPSFLLSRLAASPPPLRVELPPDTAYRHVSQLGNQLLALSPAIRVLNVEPSSIEFRLDDVVEREVPIVVPKIGALPENFALSEFSVTPDKAVLRGPSTEIGALQSLEAPPLDLRGLRESQQLSLRLTGPGRLTEVVPREVRVQVGVSAVRVPRTFEGVPVEVRTKAGNSYRVAPETVTVTALGAEELMTSLKPNSFLGFVRPPADVEAEQLEVSVEGPAGVQVTKVEPNRVVVALEGKGESLTGSAGSTDSGSTANSGQAAEPAPAVSAATAENQGNGATPAAEKRDAKKGRGKRGASHPTDDAHEQSERSIGAASPSE